MTGVMYCGAQLLDNKIFFINGWEQATTSNKNGVWWAKKDVNFWVKVGNNTICHAMGISNAVDNHFYILSGNLTKSVWKISKT